MVLTPEEEPEENDDEQAGVYDLNANSITTGNISASSVTSGSIYFTNDPDTGIYTTGTSNTTWIQQTNKATSFCNYCGDEDYVHSVTLCPRVKRVEFYESGGVRSIEYHHDW